MGTDGASSLLFSAAKRSDTFPPNIPAGLRARVSRLGGFTRPFALMYLRRGGVVGRSFGHTYLVAVRWNPEVAIIFGTSVAAPARWLFWNLMAHPLVGEEDTTSPPRWL
jgi:hypothetical protein